MREIERDLLRLLAELPLADRIELARLSRWSERAAHGVSGLDKCAGPSRVLSEHAYSAG